MGFLRKVSLCAVLATCVLLMGCAGCKAGVKPGYYMPPTPSATDESDFNKETYVWEDFIFSTNRVEKVK